MATQYPPIQPGTIVRTTRENKALRGEWTKAAIANRKWGVKGVIVMHHDSHGLCYDVQHEDGTKGSYDPSELEIVE